MWNLWWTKEHWDWFFSEYLLLYLSASFYQFSVLIFPSTHLTINTNRWKASNFKIQRSFGFRGKMDKEELSLYMNTIDKAVDIDKRRWNNLIESEERIRKFAVS